jgi:hypothetical protein
MLACFRIVYLCKSARAGRQGYDAITCIQCLIGPPSALVRDKTHTRWRTRLRSSLLTTDLVHSCPSQNDLMHSSIYRGIRPHPALPSDQFARPVCIGIRRLTEKLSRPCEAPGGAFYTTNVADSYRPFLPRYGKAPFSAQVRFFPPHMDIL